MNPIPVKNLILVELVIPKLYSRRFSAHFSTIKVSAIVGVAWLGVKGIGLSQYAKACG